MSTLSTFKSRLHSFHGIVAAVIFVTGAIVLPASAQDSKAEEAYQAAAKLYDNKLWEDAARAYKNYLKEYPKHAKAGLGHYGLGICYFNMKDYDEAADYLESAASREGPPLVDTNLLLGQALMMKNPAEPNRAELAFESGLKSLGFSKTGLLFKRGWSRKSVTQWLEKEKDRKKRQLAEEVFVGLLEATYLQKEWKSVVGKVDAFEKLVKGSQIEQRIRVLTGQAHEELKGFKQAAVAYEAAATLTGPDAPEALFRLGLIRRNHLRDYEVAAGNFRDLLDNYRSDPNRPDATFQEAMCYYDSYYAGKEAHFAKAIQLLGGFVKSNPEHNLKNTARFFVGQLQVSREEWLAAVKELEPLMGRDSYDPPLDQVVFLVADSYQHLKNYEKSAKLYMQFAKGNEKALNADLALHNAGFAYSNLKKPDIKQAIAAYKLLEEKYPNSPHLPSAHHDLGFIYYQAHRFAEARKSLRKVPANHALKADADYWLAWTDLEDGKKVEAAKHFQSLSKRLAQKTPKHPRIPLCNLYQGIAELEGRRFGESIKTLSKFMSDFPEHEDLGEAAINLGQAHLEQGDWQSAVNSFDKVPENSMYRDRALYQAAHTNFKADELEKSIRFYKELLEEKKHSSSPYVNDASYELAEVEFFLGSKKGGAPHHLADSAKRLTELLNKKPALDAQLRRVALYRLGLVQFKRKIYLESAKAFEDLLGAGEGNLLIEAAWQAGEARLQAAMTVQGPAKDREWKAALKNYEIAVQASTKADRLLQQQALLRIGEVKLDLKLWVDSQKSFELFIASNPKHGLIRRAYLGLGRALFSQEKYSGAIKSFEKTVAGGVRDDSGANAQFHLGECYFDQKKYGEAIIEFAKVEALYKFPLWQSKAVYEMAQSLVKKGNRDGARKTLERLIKSYPDTQAAAAAKSELKLLD